MFIYLLRRLSSKIQPQHPLLWESPCQQLTLPISTTQDMPSRNLELYPVSMLFFLFFFLRFFLTWTIFKMSLLNLLQYCFCFMFWSFFYKACRILAPRPGIEPKPPALEGETLTTGLPVKSRLHTLNLDNFFGRYWSPFKSRTVYFLICFSNIPHHGWCAIYENEWVKSNT